MTVGLLFSVIMKLSMEGITKKLNFYNDVINIKRDVNYFFNKNKYNAIEFKARGWWIGIYINENNKYCRIWKYEFNKNNWKKITENIKKYSNDYSIEYPINHSEYNVYEDRSNDIFK